MNKVIVTSLEGLVIVLLTIITLVYGSRNVIRYSTSGARLNVEREKSIDTIAANGNLRKFGESCNETYKCDFNNWLICETTSENIITSSHPSPNFTQPENESVTNGKRDKEGTCVCRDGDDLFFEVLSNRCVARVGATCRRILHPNNDESSRGLDLSSVGIPNGPSNISILSNANDNRIAKRIDCAHNAICDSTPIFAPRCRCHKGYYSTPHGTCHMQKTSPEPCISSEECILLLSCIDNVCQCRNSLIFDKRENRCAIPNGAPCDPLDSNQNQRVPMKFQHCTSDAVCNLLTKTCQCKNGPQSFSSDGSCRPTYGELCSKDDPCAPSYACRNGLCSCKYHFHQQYDQQTNECRSLVHGPCKEKSLLFSCTENAQCSNSTDGKFKECRCSPGYFDTENGNCLKSDETECQHDNECYPNLFCIDFKCQCQDKFQLFNSQTRRCEGIVGSRCSMNNSGNTNQDYRPSSSASTPLHCVPNAKCVSSSSNISYGHCQCDEDKDKPYFANSERTCFSYIPTQSRTRTIVNRTISTLSLD